MKKVIFFNILFLLVSNGAHAQSQTLSHSDSLQRIYEYLSKRYAVSYTSFDTTTINFRKEAASLIRSTNKDKVLTGYITLGLLDMYANRTDMAISQLKKGLQIDSTCYLCYDKLHWLYWYGKNNYGEANKYWKIGASKYEEMLRDDSSDVETWSKLYNLYKLNEGTRSLLIKQRMDYLSAKLVLLAPDNPYYWWQNSFHNEKNIPAKEYALIKAYNLQPNETIYWNTLANFYCEQRNLDKVLEIMNAVKGYEAASPSYWYQQMAVYHYRLGKKKEANDIFLEAKSKGYTIVYKY